MFFVSAIAAETCSCSWIDENGVAYWKSGHMDKVVLYVTWFHLGGGCLYLQIPGLFGYWTSDLRCCNRDSEQILANTCFPADQSQVAQRLNGMNPLTLVLSIVKILVSLSLCDIMAVSHCETKQIPMSRSQTFSPFFSPCFCGLVFQRRFLQAAILWCPYL